MRIPTLLLAAGLALASLSAVAEADHRCHTLGDYQVCTFIPGDELVDEVVDEARDPDGCVAVGYHLVCLA